MVHAIEDAERAIQINLVPREKIVDLLLCILSAITLRDTGKDRSEVHLVEEASEAGKG
jgi:hypothetical protein